MRLGLIARADRSGLGVQCLEFYRAMKPDKVLVINVGHLADDDEHCNKKTNLDLYPGAMVFNGWSPGRLTLQQFLSDLDAVFSCETFYSDELPAMARQLGVKTVLQPNVEFLRPWAAPDVWAAPSLWRFNEIPDAKVHLPVPIALDRFAAPADSPTAGSARHFLHVVGRPAVHDRNGTRDVLDAMQYVREEVVMTIRCQNGAYVRNLMGNRSIPRNVELRIDATDVENYWELYTGDVLVMPRRYGGLCLPVNEALGAGLPVIMPNIDPNNRWLPEEWLISARLVGRFRAMTTVGVHEADPRALAQKIDEFASDDMFYAEARQKASQLAKQYSWDNLLPEYEKVLAR